VAKTDLVGDLKNISERDRKQIERAREMLGPDPERMGFIKNIFWGNCREELFVPYPDVSAEETARCDQVLAELDDYFRNEHPTLQIDRDQEIPDWAVKRLFEIGVLGAIVEKRYNGGGFGITSYNRILERIGASCGSTAVMVSAHLSIGCGAIQLFGTEKQKQRFLPRVATDTLSAFCLSEPNVGCDAGGQETHCELSEDGQYYVLNGEKKWATSGAQAGLFTVLAKQKIKDPRTGKEKEAVTGLICTPDMPGVDIYSRNRAKCGIRGTWQARIRFTDVRVPKANLLHKEGKGLNVALTCLNIGRCTLAAGMVGAAKAAMEQGIKWAKYRHQFDRPINEFELVQDKIAAMAAYCYASDAMLYMTTGFVDRKDEDIMLETALCKVFCSEMGFRTVNEALQIMGGEGYMTENEVERLWRDSRLNSIVEGANEVMHSFVFVYGSKQLGEFMLELKQNPARHPVAGIRLALELYLGIRRRTPVISRLRPELEHHARELERHIREFGHKVKMMLKIHREELITRQMVQRRLSWCALWIHAMACSLSRLDKSIRDGANGEQLAGETRIVEHICALASHEIAASTRALRQNTDRTMLACAQAAITQVESLPNSDYVIPERTPDEEARGTGRIPDQTHIPQFGSGSTVATADIPT
jgi:alkylation response protein AidB-like acyl-CoA dehydrogenase